MFRWPGRRLSETKQSLSSTAHTLTLEEVAGELGKPEDLGTQSGSRALNPHSLGSLLGCLLVPSPQSILDYYLETEPNIFKYSIRVLQLIHT